MNREVDRRLTRINIILANVAVCSCLRAIQANLQ